MGIGPVFAVPRLLERHGLKVDDIDLWELNEAFASQCLYSRDKLGIDPEKYNVNGGSIAIGHPFGMTGARLRRPRPAGRQAPRRQERAWSPCASAAAWARRACSRSSEPFQGARPIGQARLRDDAVAGRLRRRRWPPGSTCRRPAPSCIAISTAMAAAWPAALMAGGHIRGHALLGRGSAGLGRGGARLRRRLGAEPNWVVSRTLDRWDRKPPDRGRPRRLRARAEGGRGRRHRRGRPSSPAGPRPGLIDEYRLYFRPFVLGGGKPYFAGARPPLRVIATEAVGEDAVR